MTMNIAMTMSTHLGVDHKHRAVFTLKRNEAYNVVSRRLMDIEASQNVAYHSALDIL